MLLLKLEYVHRSGNIKYVDGTSIPNIWFYSHPHTKTKAKLNNIPRFSHWELSGVQILLKKIAPTFSVTNMVTFKSATWWPALKWSNSRLNVPPIDEFAL